MQDIFVSTEKFREICGKCAAQKIAESQACQTVDVGRKRYIITDAVGSGKGGGWESAGGFEVMPLELYDGPYEPLSYQAHNREIQSGYRPRGYAGMKVNADGHIYVFQEKKVRFKVYHKESTQLEIF